VCTCREGERERAREGGGKEGGGKERFVCFLNC